jgi:MPBQ/MSBQ methyltransferase
MSGGTMIIATWCQREDTPETPFSDKERADLDFLYEEWAHPHFISYQEYGRLMEVRTRLCCSDVPNGSIC